MEVRKLDWDSTFFGLSIGRADVLSDENAETLANQSDALKAQFDLVYVFASHGLGFHSYNANLADEKVVYVLPEGVQGEYNNNIIVWDGNQGVTEDLLHLALVSGKYSRFKLDKAFPQGSYERLYTRWIEQSVNHAMATEVFCYMIDGVPKGLVTLDIKTDVGGIGLVAIHEDCHKRGIGTTMMRHVVHYARQQRCAKLSVATQLSNVPACKLYEKNGFVKESVTDIWHWWL